MIRYITTAIAACMLASALHQGLAQESNDTSVPPKTSERTRQMPFRGKIVKIDLEAKTVTLGGKEKDRVFAVTDQTRIKRHGEVAKLADVQVGDAVGGLARANGETWEVVTLNVNEKSEKARAQDSK